MRKGGGEGKRREGRGEGKVMYMRFGYRVPVAWGKGWGMNREEEEEGRSWQSIGRWDGSWGKEREGEGDALGKVMETAAVTRSEMAAEGGKAQRKE